MATLHLVCFAPGVRHGQSTKFLEGELRAIRLAAREWLARLDDSVASEERLSRMEMIQWEIAECALLRGVDVLLEIESRTRSDLDLYRFRAAALGAETRVYAISHPGAVLTKAHGVLEAPGLDEGW